MESVEVSYGVTLPVAEFQMVRADVRTRIQVEDGDDRTKVVAHAAAFCKNEVRKIVGPVLERHEEGIDLVIQNMPERVREVAERGRG